MNTTTDYNQSWWGRVYLLLKLDFYTYRRPLLIALGLILLFFNVIGRIGTIFGSNLSDSWFLNTPVDDRFMMISWLVFVGYTFYIHKRFHHRKPMPFVSIPAKLGEKVLAIGLGVIFIQLACFLTTYLSVLIDWLIAPKQVSLETNFDNITMVFFNKEVKGLVFVVRFLYLLFTLSFVLTLCTQFIKRKSYLASLFIGGAIYLGIWTLFGRLIYIIGEYLICNGWLPTYELSLYIEKNESLSVYATYVPIGLMLLLNLALGYYLYKRLKRIEQ